MGREGGHIRGGTTVFQLSKITNAESYYKFTSNYLWISFPTFLSSRWHCWTVYDTNNDDPGKSRENIIHYFIGKLDIYPLMCDADKVWIAKLTLIHKNIRSVHNLHAQACRSIWHKTHYDITNKNNNVSSESFNRQYHNYPSSSYQTCWDVSDNVCLDLQHCSYSISSCLWYNSYHI